MSALPALEERPGFLLLKVRAAPAASRERLVGLHGDALKAAVSAPPERGKANQAIARLVAKELGLRGSQVSVHSGETARDKWLRIDGASAGEVRERLRQALGRAAGAGNEGG
jgi:uncharacterized protein (TIGR00251 family)